MISQCFRCGLRIKTVTKFCPACGMEMGGPGEKTDACPDYYALLKVPADASSAVIRAALRQAMRLWSQRASSASKTEQRHEAEQILPRLQEAEKVLLEPNQRAAYDQTRQAPRRTPAATPHPFHAHREPPPAPITSTTDVAGEKAPLSAPTTSRRFSLLSLLGAEVIEGTVIHIDPTYFTRPELDWSRFLGKLALGILFLPVILVVGATALVISAAFSILSFGRGGGPGLFSNIASQVFSFFLIGKLFGPRREVPVRDIRLRDASGLEHLVRIQGELRAGNLNVGDDVEVEGFDRGGTLMFRGGWNRRIRSEIVVKRP